MIDKAAKSTMNKNAKLFILFAVIMLITFLSLKTIIQLSPYSPVNVHGASMAPTLSDGDFILIRSEAEKEIARDQIALFSPAANWKLSMNQSADASLLIKRIVGIPGDTVTYNDGTFSIVSKDGEKYSVANSSIAQSQCAIQPGATITVGDNEYLLAGDNRAQSFDSFAAWCSSFDPIVKASQIDVSGEITLRFKALGG